MSHREIIRNFIKTNLAKKPEHVDISDRDDIISSGIVDSLGLIKIINFLEERFSVMLRDEDVTPENFESIDAVTALLERALSGGSERRHEP